MKIEFEDNIPINLCECCGRKMIGLDALIFHSIQFNNCEYSLSEDQTHIRKDFSMGLCATCYQQILSFTLRLERIGETDS